MERPILKPVGTPVVELDTPALVVDLAVLHRNIEIAHSFFRGRRAKLRPHVEVHRCSAIAHMQLAAGGTVEGISVGTLAQGELFAGAGIRDIYVSSPVVSRQKVERLCALAHQARLSVSVDNPDNIQDLSEAASRADVTLGVTVEVNAQPGRWGVKPGRGAVKLAQQAAQAPGLELDGFGTYDGLILEEDPQALARKTKRSLQRLLDTVEMAQRSGLEVKVVRAGGTHNYEVVGAMEGITEVPAGSYALMDGRHSRFRPRLQPAARVLATVTSRPEPGLAIVDLGQKAIGADTGLPAVVAGPGITVKAHHAEHGLLDLAGDEAEKLKMGDRLWFVPWDIGTCANLYDYIHGARDGKLEVVWDVGARGLYR